MNAVSNRLGLPRVIEAAPRAATSHRPGTHHGRSRRSCDRLARRIRRGERSGASKDRTRDPDSSSDAVSLRSKLLNLRRRAIAGDPPERLAELLKMIERSNQRIEPTERRQCQPTTRAGASDRTTGIQPRPFGKSRRWPRRVSRRSAITDPTILTLREDVLSLTERRQIFSRSPIAQASFRHAIIPPGSSVKSPATPIAARCSARLPGP